MRRISTVLLLVVLLVVGLVGPVAAGAHDTGNDENAETTVQWQGQGDEHLPCEGDEHWVLASAQGVTSATLTIDGTEYTMEQKGDGSFHATTHVGFDGTQDVSAAYTGDADPLLVLSDCEAAAPEIDAQVAFVKEWTGDDHEGATATFRYELGGTEGWAAAGDVVEVTAGSTITLIEEQVDGLPDDCDYQTQLPAQTSFTADGSESHQFIVSNDVECADVLPGVPVTVEFAKAWTGDDPGDAEAVSVAVDGLGVVAFGESVDVTDWQGETLTWSEQVDGLPAGCEYTPDVTEFTVPHLEDLDDTHITITITNDVDCADVAGIQIVRPDDDDDDGVTVIRDTDPDVETEVLGVTVERLPQTGLNAWALLLIGAGLIGSGSAAVGVARRRQ